MSVLQQYCSRPQACTRGCRDSVANPLLRQTASHCRQVDLALNSGHKCSCEKSARCRSHGSAFGTNRPMRSSTALNGILDSFRNMTRDDNSKSQATISIDEDEPCPLECVRQIYTVNDYKKLAEEAHPKSLVVVDFYRTACGSCKYILPGFVKLCKRSGSHAAPVVFLKHNVMDEYEERTELADHADIRAVPSFQFWMNGKKVEQFATRDKTKLSLAIDKYVPGAVSL